jgi:hypothetical protein
LICAKNWWDADVLIKALESHNPKPWSFKITSLGNSKQVYRIIDNAPSSAIPEDKKLWLKSILRTLDKIKTIPKDVLQEIITNKNDIQFKLHVQIMDIIDEPDEEYPFLGDPSTLAFTQIEPNLIKHYYSAFDGIDPTMVYKEIVYTIERLLPQFEQGLFHPRSNSEHLIRLCFKFIPLSKYNDTILKLLGDKLLIEHLVDVLHETPYLLDDLLTNRKVDVVEIYGAAITLNNGASHEFASFIGDHYPEISTNYLTENL